MEHLPKAESEVGTLASESRLPQGHTKHERTYHRTIMARSGPSSSNKGPKPTQCLKARHQSVLQTFSCFHRSLPRNVRTLLNDSSAGAARCGLCLERKSRGLRLSAGVDKCRFSGEHSVYCILSTPGLMDSTQVTGHFISQRIKNLYPVWVFHSCGSPITFILYSDKYSVEIRQ